MVFLLDSHSLTKLLLGPQFLTGKKGRKKEVNTFISFSD